MLITRTSPLSRAINTIDIEVTEYQIFSWKNGMYIQDAMPDVPRELREFIKTGITPAEYDEMFKKTF